MKVLHVTMRQSGGEAEAARNLHLGLLAEGVDSQVLVSKLEWEEECYLEPQGLLHKVLRRIAPRIEYEMGRWVYGHPIGGNWVFGTRILKEVDRLKPDIVHLHSSGKNIYRSSDLQSIKHYVVMTLHDLSALGPGDSVRSFAGIYPPVELGPFFEGGAFAKGAKAVMKRKVKHWSNLGISVVAPSVWMKEEAEQCEWIEGNSVYHIPNAMRHDQFFFRENKETDKVRVIVVVAGADTIHKGMREFVNAVSCMSDDERSRFEFHLVGDTQTTTIFKQIEHIVDHGFVGSREELAKLYQQCDLALVPSLEDNFPNVVLEALSCGLPVVGFAIGGMVDMVKNGKNGVLATPYDSANLKYSLLEAADLLSEKAFDRRLIEENIKAKYSIANCTEEYLKLYNTLLK